MGAVANEIVLPTTDITRDWRTNMKREGSREVEVL